MKKRDYSHWSKSEYFQGVLLFAQTIDECTFPYAYESYRVPALNSHFLCYDVCITADEIESKKLMDGNFVPLSEEFELMIKEDVLMKELFEEATSVFFLKNKNSDYYDLTNEPLSAKIKYYPEIAKYIRDICEVDNKYISNLLDVICDNIVADSFGPENQELIYIATRAYITELVNMGYSKDYIYSVAENMFFDVSQNVSPTTDVVVEFFNHFLHIKNTYKVVFGVNRKAAVLFDKLNNFEVKDPEGKDKKLFNRRKNGDKIVSISVNACDPYIAFEDALSQIDGVLAIHRINQHEDRVYISKQGSVTQQIDGEQGESIFINSTQNLMKKKGNTTDLHALLGGHYFLNNISPPTSFTRAVALHNGAIESSDVSNQLLNLWTILEVLIGTQRDNADRINTICNVLCTVLNQSYMYSCLEQLLLDIKKCTESNAVVNILAEIQGDRLDEVEKFALLLSLDTYLIKRTAIIDMLEEYPLLVYRIKKFSNDILCNSKSIYEYLKRHEKRIRWHIMRIYRNRNMIVHDGSYMPYIKIITENLHFYIDELLDVLVEYYHVKMLDNSSIYKNISVEEFSYYKALGYQIGKNKGKTDIKTITEENALNLIFNGYHGKVVSKTIDNVIAENKIEEKL